MPRRIKKARIEFISLVPAGANKMPVIYKSDGSIVFDSLTKASEDLGELLNVVYAPEHRDSQGDIADAAVIKDAAYDAAMRGLNIDIRHDGKAVPREKAFLAENFIVAKGDERFQGWKDRDGKEVDLTGAWATVIKINDPDLRAKYRSGEWAGVSMGGTAVVEHEKAESSFDLLVEALSKAINPPAQTQSLSENDMTPEQLEKLQKTLTDSIGALAENLTKALGTKKSDDSDDKKVTKEDKPPKFRGNLSDELAVRKHAIQVALWKMEKGIDWEDLDSVQEFVEASKELNEELAEIEKEQAEEKKKTRRAGPASRQTSNQPESSLIAGLSKELSDEFALGSALAEAISKELGYVKAAKED